VLGVEEYELGTRMRGETADAVRGELEHERTEREITRPGLLDHGQGHGRRLPLVIAVPPNLSTG
jgi:hypothetical protein